MNIKDITQPKYIAGSTSTDDRGTLSFVNNFFLDGLKRFYIIENHQDQFIRAYHGHQNEWKVFIPLVGSFLVLWRDLILDANGKVDFQQFATENKPKGQQVLSERSPGALVLPGGYLNGTMNLTPGAKLLVLSSSTIEESKTDDYRAAYEDVLCKESNFFNLEDFSIPRR